MPREPLVRARLSYVPHPFRLYRPKALARLLGVDITTIWRWEKDGVLPPAAQLAPGCKGWTEDRVAAWLEKCQRDGGSHDDR